MCCSAARDSARSRAATGMTASTAAAASPSSPATGATTCCGPAPTSPTSTSGDGNDTVAFDGAPGPVQVDLGSPAAQDVGGFGDQTLLDVEGLIGSSFGDRLTGTAGPDAIDGG